MELEAVRRLSPAEGLVPVLGELASLVAPRGRVNVSPCHWNVSELRRELREHRIAARGLREVDGQEADLRTRPLVDAGAEADREQLGTETGAEERDAGVDRLADQSLLVAQPRQALLVVDAHRAAHRHDQVELAPVRKLLPSSSSTRASETPCSSMTSSYTPGGSQAMCWRTSASTVGPPVRPGASGSRRGGGAWRGTAPSSSGAARRCPSRG